MTTPANNSPAQTFFEAWPNCATPDCGYKVCTWADTTQCARCCYQRLGAEEMIRRYNATHKRPWKKPFPPGAPHV